MRVGMKILYRNVRRPGEAGMKLVPDQSQTAVERKVLEELGFTVIENTSAPVALVSGALLRESRGLR
jgi:hypothetical protein